MEMLPLFVRRHDLEVFLIIRGIFEYLLLLVAAGDDVIEGAGIFDAGLRGIKR